MNYFLLLLALVSGSSAWADPLRDDGGWLNAMAFAAHRTNYSGTFVYQDGEGGHVDVSRITHILDAAGEHERLEGLNGVRHEIVSSNNQVWLYLGDRKIRIQKRHDVRAFPALLPEQIATVKESYSIMQLEEDRVAGFHVHTVVFKPKDNLRYTHKMWAHTNSGLLLKAVVLDERNRIIEQYAFTQLSLANDIDRSWILPKEAEPAVPINLMAQSKPSSELKTQDWQVDALPAGFKRTMEVCRPMRNRAHPVAQLVFSDGLVGISVFIETVRDATNINAGLSNKGAIQIFSKVSGDKLITVVGEVPPRTVMQVAESVRYTGQ
ncbi:MAG: MucB/RseB C-terminal domain-containing protein [Gallionellaceae bacterium]|nr:MucB/RseB C-terminal domain-containing protein [Gallionellaceae bacterium]